MAVRTHGPDLWGVFSPDWFDGLVPVFTGTVFQCCTYART